MPVLRASQDVVARVDCDGGFRFRAIEAAKLEVPIAAEFPLADAAKAQERMAAGHVLGKIVLRIR